MEPDNVEESTKIKETLQIYMMKGITSLYLPEEEVLIEPDDIEESPKIKETLQIHMIKRFFDQRKVAYLEFYAMSTDKKSFFTQYYPEGACWYEQISSDNSHCRSCLGDYETNEEWSQCPTCRVWFHSYCFYSGLKTNDVLDNF